MSKPLSPQRWANDLTILLNARDGSERFPIDVPALATSYSQHRFPEDPIVAVRGGDLPGFEGALYPVKKGWAIVYNDAISSPGRVNFTLAHEFGHYLMHREQYPEGFKCSQRDVVTWDSEYGQIEYQANVFASNLLMPLDDFRRQIEPTQVADFAALQACAERYNVSLAAATYRWLEYTEKRAIFVISTDDYILRAKSSKPALFTGAYFRTSDGPIEVPVAALPRNPKSLVGKRGQLSHPAGVWLPREPVEEHTILAQQYAFSMTLLLLPNHAPAYVPREERGGFQRF